MKLKRLLKSIVLPIDVRVYDIYIQSLDRDDNIRIKLPNEYNFVVSEQEEIEDRYISIIKHIIKDEGNYNVVSIEFYRNCIRIDISKRRRKRNFRY